MTYDDTSLDLVLTSETLEHVPDLMLALSEIHRVLRPGGQHIFTTPVVSDGRATRRRARIVDGHVDHLLPPSYHGPLGTSNADRLVFFEFGDDLVEAVEGAGFDIQVHGEGTNPALKSFISVKCG